MDNERLCHSGAVSGGRRGPPHPLELLWRPPDLVLGPLSASQRNLLTAPTAIYIELDTYLYSIGGFLFHCLVPDKEV